MRRRLVAVLIPVILICLGWFPARATADLVYRTSSQTADPDGPVAAQATFTAVNGGIQVVLQNTGPTPMSQGQAVSQLFFSVGGQITGAVSNGSKVAGNTITYQTTPPTLGTYNGSLSGAHWGFGSLGSSHGVNDLELATVATGGNDPVAPGGQPHYMIMSQNALPGSNVTNFDPYFNGSATFFLAYSGVTSGMRLTSSDIFNVDIGFGTGPEANLGARLAATPVPVPASVVLMGIGGALCLGYGRRASRRRAQAG